MENIKKCSPVLLVGGYVADLKKMYKGTVFYLREKEDMNEFVRDNSGKIFPFVLVIDIGIGCIPHIDGLLKFVEEYSGPLIITSHRDITNVVFLSRLKIVMRKSNEDVNFRIPSHKNTLMEGISEETKLADPIIWYDYIKGLHQGVIGEKNTKKCIDIIYS